MESLDDIITKPMDVLQTYLGPLPRPTGVVLVWSILFGLLEAV
jgi:hypothetical protein